MLAFGLVMTDGTRTLSLPDSVGLEAEGGQPFEGYDLQLLVRRA